MFTQLLQISREACRVGCHATAYHALAAALHCARQEQELFEVEWEARKQLAHASSKAPLCELSLTSHSDQGPGNVLDALAQQASVKRRMLSPMQE